MHKIKVNFYIENNFFLIFYEASQYGVPSKPFVLRSALSAPNTFRPSFGFANVEP